MYSVIVLCHPSSCQPLFHHLLLEAGELVVMEDLLDISGDLVLLRSNNVDFSLGYSGKSWLPWSCFTSNESINSYCLARIGQVIFLTADIFWGYIENRSFSSALDKKIFEFFDSKKMCLMFFKFLNFKVSVVITLDWSVIGLHRLSSLQIASAQSY